MNEMKDRLTRFNEAVKLCRSGGIDLKEFWSLDPNGFRFHLGESIKDIKLPCCFGHGTETLFSNAFNEFVVLLKKRFSSEKEGGIDLALMTDEGKEVRLRRPTSKIAFFMEGTRERGILESIVRLQDVLDMGIMVSWLDKGGTARRLFPDMLKVYDKSLVEDLSGEANEELLFFTHLAFLRSFMERKEVLKTLNFKGISYERLEQAVGYLFYGFFERLFFELFNERLKRGGKDRLGLLGDFSGDTF